MSERVDGLRVVWEEREEVRHAVTVAGVHIGAALLTDKPLVTDCGIELPFTAIAIESDVTCEACLWGWLDPALREFNREPVTA